VRTADRTLETSRLFPRSKNILCFGRSANANGHTASRDMLVERVRLFFCVTGKITNMRNVHAHGGEEPDVVDAGYQGIALP
jgi:hypothetical protein